MKERILYGWNFNRILFLVVGIIMIIQSVMDKQQLGIFIGGYFAAMGIFRFGCAGGACYGNFPRNTAESKMNKKDEIEFEEIKEN